MFKYILSSLLMLKFIYLTLASLREQDLHINVDVLTLEEEVRKRDRLRKIVNIQMTGLYK